MTAQLIKYEAARRALAECTSVDEVKGWADKAAAMQAYQRMAGDRTLESQASEIRIRAERRLGELILAQKASGGLAKPGVKPSSNSVVANDRIPKLADVGITKDLSSRAQKLAAVPEDQFEAELAAKRDRERQDGARVSARLERAGEKVLRQEAVEDFGPSEEEIFTSEREVAADMERMRLILESDEPLAALAAKCKQQAAMIDKQDWRIRGLVNENADLLRRLKSAMAKIDRIEKAAA